MMFTNRREYQRAIELIDYYQNRDVPFRFSKFSTLPVEKRHELMGYIRSNSKKIVSILSFCLMPNHFHFLLKQMLPNGVSQFTANFTNSYTKYFNTKHKRMGSLTQGLFKAVRIETDEQLVHTSRYIHLNPVTSFLIKINELGKYPWSSYSEYIEDTANPISSPNEILSFFPSTKKYKEFVEDQVGYAQELEKIKHVIID